MKNRDKLGKNQYGFSQGVLLYITLVPPLTQYIQKTECHFDNPTSFISMKLFMKIQKLNGFSTRCTFNGKSCVFCITVREVHGIWNSFLINITNGKVSKVMNYSFNYGIQIQIPQQYTGRKLCKYSSLQSAQIWLWSTGQITEMAHSRVSQAQKKFRMYVDKNNIHKTTG